MQRSLERNQTAAEYWAQFVATELPEVDSQAVAAGVAELARVAASLCQEKAAAVLKPLNSGPALAAARAAFKPIAAQIEQYNQRVAAGNALIAAKKAEVKTSDLIEARKRHAVLQARLARFGDRGVDLARRHEELQKQKTECVAEKKTAKEGLDDYTSNVIVGFQERINALLQKFGATFRIIRTAHNYQGRKPRSSYSLQINGVTVDLGDPKTPLSEPSFRNTLSAGDRRTLALAFFLVQADLDLSLGKKVLVLDDPFTSQDRARRVSTQQEILRLSSRAKQIILLSHERVWLHDFWKRCGGGAKAMQFSKVGADSSIVEWDDIASEALSERLARIDALTRYVHGDEATPPEKVVPELRKCLEEFLRTRHPKQFPPDRKEWLGDYIGRIRNAESESPIRELHSILSELDAINDFSKGSHHAAGEGEKPQDLDDDEVRAHTERVLAIVDPC